MKSQTKRRRKTRQTILAYLKLRIYRVIAILILSVAVFVTVGMKIAELDTYMDRQIERLRARR